MVVQGAAKAYLVPLHRLSQVWNCSFIGGDVGRTNDQGQGQQTSWLAGWPLCESFLFTLKRCDRSLSSPLRALPISLHKNMDKGKNQKHTVGADMAGSSMEIQKEQRPEELGGLLRTP